jgi:hypothetical protein
LDEAYDSEWRTLTEEEQEFVISEILGFVQ